MAKPETMSLDETWEWYSQKHPQLAEDRGPVWNAKYNKNLLNLGWFAKNVSEADRWNARRLLYARAEVNFGPSRLENEPEFGEWETP